MTHRPSSHEAKRQARRQTRRRFLAGALGGTAAVAALPVICTGTSHAGTAAGGHGELPLVTHPRHPAAEYAAGGAEPLNAGVDCGLPQAPGHGQGAL
ncbi:hypothetical protein [Streptomyces sp. B6B3]|uniref:hypothetical protein n=1 Tax=Streptomyces sp. B6B3 TaxID=3153570 RepID=UPI00325D2B11